MTEECSICSRIERPLIASITDPCPECKNQLPSHLKHLSIFKPQKLAKAEPRYAGNPFEASTPPTANKPSDEAIFINAFKCQAIQAYQISLDHGFHEKPNNFGERIALMHSELSEALESFRKGDGPDDHIPDFTGAEAEFADVIIRIFDAAVEFDLRVAEAVIAKMKYNSGRSYKHGGKKF